MPHRTIEARIQQLEDREAIKTLITRYSLAVDDHDFNELGSLWAPDARYGFFDDVQAEGAENVAALLENNVKVGGASFHTNHDHLIEWQPNDPDRASGILCTHAEITLAGGHHIAGIRYKDKYVRHQGQWLFAERFLGFLYLSPAEDYAGLLLKRERLVLPGSPASPAHWPDFA